MTTNKNSMLYWYPLIQNLDIPQPKTEIVPLEHGYFETLAALDGNQEAIKPEMWKLEAAMKKFDLPIFLRTDHTSGKHDWKDTCYVTDVKRLRWHVSALVEDTALKEIDLRAFIFREYIEMASGFTAFGYGLPINPERRYFIQSEVICHHPYWTHDAIAESDLAWARLGKSRLPKNWIELLVKMNKETDEEIELLSSYAQQIASVVDGYWSIDFCKALDGRWILIDMAMGESSWHDESCQHHPAGDERNGEQNV